MVVASSVVPKYSWAMTTALLAVTPRAEVAVPLRLTPRPLEGLRPWAATDLGLGSHWGQPNSTTS